MSDLSNLATFSQKRKDESLPPASGGEARKTCVSNVTGGRCFPDMWKENFLLNYLTIESIHFLWTYKLKLCYEQKILPLFDDYFILNSGEIN